MKTRCPTCQTIFRVSPEQLKARAGKVRCGQCQDVFNALDHLLDENAALVTKPIETAKPAAGGTVAGPAPAPITPHRTPPMPEPVVAPPPPASPQVAASPKLDNEPRFFVATDEIVDESSVETLPPPDATEPNAPLDEHSAKELGKATGLILPRETTEVPGYSKWSEDTLLAPLTLPEEKPTRWPFVLVALLLIFCLAGQATYRFRSEIATAVPAARPLLASLCQSLGVDLPLPRRVELVSLEVSDLQNDPEHDNLLLLTATLHNRASFAQAYPSLELALTDTQDAAIARRVFSPTEYLSPKLSPTGEFRAGSDLVVRLWLDASDITASGYRLYVFYP